MTRARRAGAALLLLSGGCQSLESQFAEDRAAVAAAVAERGGVVDGRTRARLPGEAGDARDAADGTAAEAAAPADGAVDEAAVAALVARALADGVTEAEAVELALLLHPGLAAQVERLGVARAQLRRAVLPSNPLLAANWKFFAGPDEIELSLTQPFFDLLFAPLRRRLAEAERSAIEAQVTEALVHHLYEVRRAHARALAAEQRLARARLASAADGASAELMQLLHDAGNVVDPQRTHAAIDAAVAKERALAATLEQRVAQEALQRAIGLEGAVGEWQVAGDWPPPLPLPLAPSEAAARAVERSLALAESRARIVAAAERIGVEGRAAWLGDGEAGVAAKHETSGDWGVGPALALSLPLFDAGGAARFEGGAQLRAEQLAARALQLEVESHARAAATTARLAAERAAAARDVEQPLHAQLVRETVQQYNAMQIGAFDVLAARREELAAEERAIELAVAARVAALELAELLAGSRPHSGDREP